MKIYKIVLPEDNMFEKTHYILAEDFDDAYKQALKMREKIRKEFKYEEANIKSISEEFEIEVVK